MTQTVQRSPNDTFPEPPKYIPKHAKLYTIQDRIITVLCLIMIATIRALTSTFVLITGYFIIHRDYFDAYVPFMIICSLISLMLTILVNTTWPQK